MKNTRRSFLKVASATAGVSALTGLAGCASVGGVAKPRVVVVGGGYGGATAAKYIKLWGPDIDVTVVERNPNFISCPISNLVLGGSQKMDDITMSYAALQSKYGVKVVRGEAIAIDVEKKMVRLAGGEALPYDRVVVSPGIDFMYEALPGLNNADAQHATFTRGRPVHRPSPCANNWRPWQTAVCMRFRFRRHRIVAHRDRTSEPAKSPLTSNNSNPGPRC